MKVYKITDDYLQTRGGFQWVPGEWRETSGRGPMCGSGWLHFFWTPELAALLHPVYTHYSTNVLWEAEAGKISRNSHGVKGASTQLRILQRIEMPEATTQHRVRFAELISTAVKSHRTRFNALFSRKTRKENMVMEQYYGERTAQFSTLIANFHYDLAYERLDRMICDATYDNPQLFTKMPKLAKEAMK
jgi:hypothetical protein